MAGNRENPRNVARLYRLQLEEEDRKPVMPYDLAKHDFDNPNPWIALDLDQSTFFGQAKAALLRGNASKSRQFLLPVVRPIARLSIIVLQLIRIAVPNRLTSARYLHAVIVWGMRNFLSPDANYLIFRHFHIGSQILNSGSTMLPVRM